MSVGLSVWLKVLISLVCVEHGTYSPSAAMIDSITVICLLITINRLCWHTSCIRLLFFRAFFNRRHASYRTGPFDVLRIWAILS